MTPWEDRELTSRGRVTDPGEDESPFSLALIVATRSRPDDIALRLPYWTRAGFDEVIIVDGSYDKTVRTRIKGLCDEFGATYLAAPRTLKDLRSFQWNLGAKRARSSWILIQGDDDDVPLRIEKDALAKAAVGKDWLTGPIGETLLWHRRESFLRIGGYPEDMVAAEDGIMSNRARRYGRGGLEPVWYHELKDFPPPRRDPMSRMRNAFWYGYTVLVLFLRTHNRRDVALGDARRLLYEFLRTPKEPWRLLSVPVGFFARLLSPLHCLRIALRSGWSSLRQEPYADWQGLRPTRQDRGR